MSEWSYCNFASSFRQPSHRAPGPGPPVIVCLDLDQFYVQVHRRRDPTLVGVPVGVAQNHELACVSYEVLTLIPSSARPCPT